MDIGRNIQTIRYQRDLTQDQVVAKLNLMGISISKSSYAKLETNRMNIKVNFLTVFLRMKKGGKAFDNSTNTLPPLFILVKCNHHPLPRLLSRYFSTAFSTYNLEAKSAHSAKFSLRIIMSSDVINPIFINSSPK